MIQAHRDHTNIKRSFQNRIGQTVESPHGTFNAYHDYAFADPDLVAGGAGIGEAFAVEDGEEVTEDFAWIETRWLAERAGGRGWSVAQVDVFSRAGAPTSERRDPMGLVVERLASEVQQLFRGVASPTDNWFVEVLDFTDVDDPTGTGEFLVVQSSGNLAFGEAEERHRHPLQDGLQRVTLTFSMRLVQDAAGPAAFYVR